MVWAKKTSGKTSLIFVDPRVKISKDYYLREILKRAVKTWTVSHFKPRDRFSHQDSAPAHEAKEVRTGAR